MYPRLGAPVIDIFEFVTRFTGKIVARARNPRMRLLLNAPNKSSTDPVARIDHAPPQPWATTSYQPYAQPSLLVASRNNAPLTATSSTGDRLSRERIFVLAFGRTIFTSVWTNRSTPMR